MNDCILWDGTLSSEGYGRVGHQYAHRVAWEEHVGPIPEGLFVLHHCDVRCCVNIEHLHLGDQSMNIQEMHDRGRHPYDGDRCQRGHPLSGANLGTFVHKNGATMRICKTCRAMRERRYYAEGKRSK